MPNVSLQTKPPSGRLLPKGAALAAPSIFGLFTKAAPFPDASNIHAIADKLEPEVRRAFLEAVKDAKGRVKLDEIQGYVQRGDIEGLISFLQERASLAPALQATSLTTALGQVFNRTASSPANKEVMAEAQGVPIGEFRASFSIVNPRSVAFARDYDFGLIREVSNATRDAIRQIVTTGVGGRGTIYQQSKLIQELVGLTKRQAQAVLNYRTSLEQNGMPPGKVAKLVEQYAYRKLRERSTNIARTETIRASNAGRIEGWLQAIESGELDAATRMRWVVTDDDRTCEFCLAIPGLNPDGVPVGGLFKTASGYVKHPPLHPQCRCGVTLVIKR